MIHLLSVGRASCEVFAKHFVKAMHDSTTARIFSLPAKLCTNDVGEDVLWKLTLRVVQEIK